MSERDKFSVWVFDGEARRLETRILLDIGTALGLAFELTDRPDAQRIIITDSGDDTVWEWVYNKGITWQ
jgi:hypothetical protein